jgi:beta-glucanase (GH16 family)
MNNLITHTMKKIFLLLFIGLPLIAFCQSNLSTEKSQIKTLVWSDEFNGNGLPDENKWNFEVGKAKYNNEPQYYTKDLKNINLSDGKMTITTLLEYENGVKKYTSARINTMGKFDFTYGRVEVRANLPTGRGIWPAIWTLGVSGPWPACGEIDIMEFWGHQPDTVFANVHTRDYNHRKSNGRGGNITYDKLSDDFHVFAVEWYKDRMDFYLDDKMYYSCKSKGEGPGEWPFFAPQYLILNQALWNNWKEGDPGIDDSIFPQQFIIDYVRVYELK